MNQLYLFVILLVVAGVAAAGYWFFKRRREERWLDEAIGSDLLASWQYTASEWQQAVADEFSWGKPDAGSAEIFIYPSVVYIKSGSRKRFLQLERDGRVVTFAGYARIEGSPLKLRVRWKVVTYDQYNRPETTYYKEDYRIPVPQREEPQALKVVEFFTNRLENNLEAYTSVVPDDEPISLFGKDSF